MRGQLDGTWEGGLRSPSGRIRDVQRERWALLWISGGKWTRAWESGERSEHPTTQVGAGGSEGNYAWGCWAEGMLGGRAQEPRGKFESMCISGQGSMDATPSRKPSSLTKVPSQGKLSPPHSRCVPRTRRGRALWPALAQPDVPRRTKWGSREGLMCSLTESHTYNAAWCILCLFAQVHEKPPTTAVQVWKSTRCTISPQHCFEKDT